MGAGKEKPAKKRGPGGPFLAAAVVCGNILEEMGGVLTAHRMVDTFNILIPSNAPADMPSKENPVDFQVNILIAFKSGGSSGKHSFKMIMESPSGKRKPVEERELVFNDQAQGGYNLKIGANVKAYTSGVFWFDVVLDRKRYTRIPLSVNITREGAVPPKKEKSDKQIKK